jgi:hypothetical protein
VGIVHKFYFNISFVKIIIIFFELEVLNTTHEWRYQYGCAKAVVPINCREVTTERKSAENFYINTLRHHDIRCPSNEYLSGFEVEKNLDISRGVLVWYEYYCCKFF